MQQARPSHSHPSIATPACAGQSSLNSINGSADSILIIRLYSMSRVRSRYSKATNTQPSGPGRKMPGAKLLCAYVSAPEFPSRNSHAAAAHTPLSSPLAKKESI
jgi:hypothetical protein